MVTSLGPADLAGLLATRRDVEVIDVRDQADWDAGHIEGARLIPLETLRADPEAVLAHGHPLVFVCAKGVRSLAAAKLADRFGYADLYSLEGGTKEWARSGLPLVATRAAA